MLLLLLAACGGEAGRAEDGRAPGPRITRGERATTTVAALGDSISAGSPLWDPDPAKRLEIGPAATRESQYQHWAERRLPGTRFLNCGVFGERTDEIARRLRSCSKNADSLIVQGGINDVAQGRPVAAAARALRAMVQRGERLGMRVALAEVLPWNNGPPPAELAIVRLNRAIRRIGREERVPVLAWYGRLEDPGRPGRMRADWTIDGDHPSIAGYRRLADTVALP
jgi:lysophospholipase L1-like esterase